MPINNFMRFAEVVTVKEEKRVVGVTVRPTIADCTGAIYFTDLQLQEGSMVTGYTKDTRTMMGGGDQPEHWFNGIVRTGATVIIPNLGETSAPLDVACYPLQSMDAASISVSQGQGAHRATFLDPASAGDEFVLQATSRKCQRNGKDTPKDGFFQYTAAQDSKHPVTLSEKRSARLLLTYREMKDGEPKP